MGAKALQMLRAGCLPALGLGICMLLTSCGGGGGGSGGSAVVPGEQETLAGKVIDGDVSGAVVCLDANANGHCEAWESQAVSDASGAYRLSIPSGATGPLLAEINAGVARDSDSPDRLVDRSYRMVSPSKAYGTNITPFSTMVHLTGLADYALAEDLVRNELGLPPKFAIALTAAPAAGSYTAGVAKAIVTALKETGTTLDLSAPTAMQALVAAFPPALTDLPQLVIATRDAAPIVSRDVYVDATFTLTNPAVSSEPMALNGKIRGRGHSTWGNPKNPYKVQFANDDAYAAVPDFLGMKKNRNWALLADWFDRSLIRNKLALSLGNSVAFSDGLKWTPSGQHVEAWLNGDYIGVYLLTEDIRIDPARLPLKKMSSSAAANDVDGGYIVEVDVRLDCYNEGDLNLQLVTPHNTPICIDTPDEGAITLPQLAYIKNVLREAEKDLFESNRLDRLNTVSFADWYLLEELLRNVDANFISSDYMWKDTDAAANPADRRLNMGPIWDFDRGAGNANYFEAWRSAGCWTNAPSEGIDDGRNWYTKLFDNAEFLALTLDRWRVKKPLLERFVNASVDTYARRLAAAQTRNFARWPILGEQLTNYYTFATWDEEVAFVKRFLDERLAWLDRAYASPAAFDAMCRTHPTQ